jgi:hypothetical protein
MLRRAASRGLIGGSSPDLPPAANKFRKGREYSTREHRYISTFHHGMNRDPRQSGGECTQRDLVFAAREAARQRIQSKIMAVNRMKNR